MLTILNDSIPLTREEEGELLRENALSHFRVEWGKMGLWGKMGQPNNSNTTKIFRLIFEKWLVNLLGNRS